MLLDDDVRREYTQMFNPKTKKKANAALDLRDLVIIGSHPQKGYCAFIKPVGVAGQITRYETFTEARLYIEEQGYKLI